MPKRRRRSARQRLGGAATNPGAKTQERHTGEGQHEPRRSWGRQGTSKRRTAHVHPVGEACRLTPLHSEGDLTRERIHTAGGEKGFFWPGVKRGARGGRVLGAGGIHHPEESV